MSKATGDVDQIFKVLADGTRRGVLERLVVGPATVTELAAPFSMSLPSFLQHLSILEDSGLVRTFKQGRMRVVELVPHALFPAESWLQQQRCLWDKRLDQLDEYLKTM